VNKGHTTRRNESASCIRLIHSIRRRSNERHGTEASAEVLGMVASRAFGLVVMIAVFSACSGGNSGTGAPTAHGVNATGNVGRYESARRVCALVTARDASQLFGQPAASSGSQNGDGCAWTARSRGTDVVLLLLTTVVDGSPSSSTGKVSGATQLQGIADDAWIDLSAPGSAVLEFRRHGRTVRLAFSISGPTSGPGDARAEGAKLIALARKVADST
jgi:hypothetical protein